MNFRIMLVRAITSLLALTTGCSLPPEETRPADVLGQQQLAGQIKDTKTHAPVAGARVLVLSDKQSAVAYTDSNGLFVLDGAAKDGSGKVVVSAEGYEFVETNVELRKGTQLQFTLNPQQLAVTPADRIATQTKRSPDFPSGVGRNWSGWYRLCSDPIGPNEEIVGAEFRLEGDRNCGSWAECRELSRQPQEACWEFRMQGHDELPFPGQQPSHGILTYKVRTSGERPGPTPPRRGVVYVQYAGSRGAIDELESALRAEDYSVVSVETPERTFQDSVRYFHDEDLKSAKRLAEIAARAGRDGKTPTAMYISGFKSRVPLGQFEIWIHASR